MSALILYALLTPAMFYLASQAVITKPLWSHYPAWLDSYFSCASCSGFAFGLLIALTLGRFAYLDFLQLDSRAWYTPIVVGLGAIVWTPIVANFQISALYQLAGAPSTAPTAAAQDQDD
jgi:hypothetical protein